MTPVVRFRFIPTQRNSRKRPIVVRIRIMNLRWWWIIQFCIERCARKVQVRKCRLIHLWAEKRGKREQIS